MMVKKQHNRSLYITVIVIIAVLAALIGGMFIIPDTKDEPVSGFMYNGYKFMNVSGEYYVNVYVAGRDFNQNIEMRNSPMSLENVPIESDIVDIITNAKTLTLTVDNNASAKSVIAAIEVGRITGEKYNIYNIPTSSALTSPDGTNLVKTCADSNAEDLVVYFRVQSPTLVYSRDDCVYVQGATDDELIKAADRLGYGLLGVFG